MPHFNPYDWSFHEDPYPIYRALRDEAPVYHNAELGFYALSRYDDVLRGLKDWQQFSNREGVALESLEADPAKVYSMLGMDPPRQAAVRGIVRKVFTPRRVDELEPWLRGMARDYIERFAASGEVEFIEDFAGRVPMDVISEMIGVPAADRDQVRKWANDLMERVDGSNEVPPLALQSTGALLMYLHEMVQERKSQPMGDDLTTAVLNAELEGESLTADEVVSFLFLMCIAGNETTTKLLANALYWGQRYPEQFAKVQQDRSRVADWVEETARFDNSSQILYRLNTQDIDLHGVTIPEGTKVAMLIGAANRDERKFSAPDEYNIDRNLGDTLAFGKGIHFCLGAALARLEGRVFLDELFKTYDRYEVDETSLVRVHSGNVRGFSTMQVRFR